jgi:phenylpropionate dioxygenase-like ring-hydroxylating dioxygenase large terminal subunit
VSAKEILDADFRSGRIREDFVPSGQYTDPSVAELEKSRLWPRIWHIACREEEIPSVGDFVNYEIFDESILVVRTAEHEISAFYNVCQHRGRRLKDEERGSVAQGFYCRFHGWRYGLDGKVTYIHDRPDWEACKDFKESDLNLKRPPHVGRWAGWVWINMDPDAPSLEEWLGPAIMKELENFDIEKMRFAWYETIIAPVNWKVVVEAFNEGYHAGATHAYAIDYKRARSDTTIHGLHARYNTIFHSPLPNAKREDGQWSETRTIQEAIYFQALEVYETLNCLVMKPLMNALTRMKNETKPDDPPEQVFGKLWDWHRQELQAAGLVWPERLTPADNTSGSWVLFPNTIMFPAIDGILWYRMRPHGHESESCLFDIWCLRPFAPGKQPNVKRHVSDGFEAFRGRNLFLEQDFANMIAVNKGMKSRGWNGARTNPKQEIQVSHFHRLLQDYMRKPPGP